MIQWPDFDAGQAVERGAQLFGAGVQLFRRQQRALVKLDRDGEVRWQHAYGGGGQGAVRGLDVLPDGTVLATGYVDSPDPGFLFIADDASGFLLAVDADGGLLWEQALDLPQGTKVRGEAAGTIAVLSTAWVEAGGTEAQNMVVVRADAGGSPVERFEVGGGEHVQAFDFDLTADGGFVLAGHSPGLGGENWDCAVASAARLRGEVDPRRVLRRARPPRWRHRRGRRQRRRVRGVQRHRPCERLLRRVEGVPAAPRRRG